MLRSVSEKMFGERLTAIDGFDHVKTYRPSGNLPRVWLGIKLKPKATSDD